MLHHRLNRNDLAEPLVQDADDDSSDDHDLDRAVVDLPDNEPDQDMEHAAEPFDHLPDQDMALAAEPFDHLPDQDLYHYINDGSDQDAYRAVEFFHALDLRRISDEE